MAGTPWTSRVIATPARGTVTRPGCPNVAGLKRNDSNSGIWSVRNGLTPEDGRKPELPGGITDSADTTRAVAGAASSRAAARVAAARRAAITAGTLQRVTMQRMESLRGKL